MKKLIFVFAFFAFSCGSDDDNSPIISGCTDPSSFNYDANANTDDGSCIPVLLGCTDLSSFNYDANANTDDGSCIPVLLGCTDPSSFNYDANANTDDGSCVDETTNSLIGTWVSVVQDLEDGDEGVNSLVLKADGTGSRRVLYSLSGELIYSDLTWSTAASVLTLDYDGDEENSVLNYSIISDDSIQITDEEGDINIAHRLNTDLVGSWSGVLTEEGGSQGQITIYFYDDSLGVEEIVWSPSDSSNEAITWMSTSTEITIFFNDSASDNLILGYTFVDTNNVDISIEGEFATTLTRN